MNKRTIRTIILIAVIILLLLIIAYFLWMFKFPGSVIPKAVSKATTSPITNTIGQNSTIAATTPVTPVKPSVPPASSETITQANLVKIADSFAERLGSYSNQSNFSNINDLKLLMTASMQSWADKYIAANQKAAYSGVYQGVTTRAISTETIDFNDAKGQADFLVHTQKVAQTGADKPVVTYQDISIAFVKQNNIWLVDNAVWKK
ncbi:MAG: hypothetical protein PHE24_01090 [Patescibacteria group bacterium]|nr:hypothetical protein [Patescibacteria group bacterium]